MITTHSEQERFTALVEASPMPTAIYKGREMIISIANKAMLDLWGKDGSVIGKSLAEALPELDGQPFHAILANVFDTGESYYAKESRADLVVDGKLQTFYFTFTYKPLKDSDGYTYAIINTAAHLTELVSARKEIAETQERLSFALQSAGIGTWDLDPIHNKVNWDNRCRELFGFPVDGEIHYKDVLDCIHPDDQNMVNAAVIDAIDPKNEGNYDIRYRIIIKQNNQIRWVHCKGKAYFNAENKAYRFAGIAQDITGEVIGRQREQQLMSLVSHNADHMSIADMEGNLIYMNAASRNLLGVGLEADVTTFSAHDFYTPEELDRVQHHIIKEIKDETGWQGTINLQNFTTKEIIPCNVNYILIKDPETGEIIGRGATARDLRPEIRAKAELQRLATIVDSSEDFCNYCDIEGNTFYINPSGIKLIGIAEENIGKSNLFDYHSEATNKLIKNEILPVLFNFGKWSGALELRHQKTGEIIPIHKQLYMIREEITNTPVGIAGIARDLRPELNVRKTLNDKNEALQSVVNELNFLADTVPSIVWTSKPDGNLDYINQRWYDQSGRSKHEVISESWAEAVHPEDKLHAFAAWAKSLKTGDSYETEFRMKDRNGNYRWFLVRALPLKDAEGKIVKWYGTNTDVQHQKELERQKDNFLGIASHELKTPVTSLKAYAQVLESMFKRSGDLKNADFLSRMNKQVDRLTNLIGDLLDVTKINGGRLQFNHSTFGFNEMVEEVVEDVQRTSSKQIIKKNLNFKREVFGDRERICQVLTNLLTNALKYSPDASEIVIYTEDHENNVQVCVQDYGIGISGEKKDRVFEQFYRVSGNKQHTFPGLGLGLYISSEIVKRLNGKIWVNSVEDKGSTFCFSIPIRQETAL
ncbi:PAS domain-containing protein [Pedobacter rhodius]|uniref:histidine kinase n=1 Tax=Pedobacter rhodius TaxID=3004098 RepID=A0ABT4L5B3_9SPHI|nr:PAS domain-containing protein [Pedobacter sp. SJ11]MCZ4225253.1 PAS domain-containing protein [Pedobacter sp. SJ11]